MESSENEETMTTMADDRGLAKSSSSMTSGKEEDELEFDAVL